MCTSAPKAPDLPAARQAPRLPDAADIGNRSQADLLRRSTMRSMILTNPNGLGAAPTAGKAVLGA